MAQIIEFIYTEEMVGNGIKDPYRKLRQLWSKDGVLIAEFDPATEEMFFRGLPF